MAQIEANGIGLEYETHGDPSDAALVIVRGLGTQMIHWPEAFIDGLVAQGFYVVRFDNRDVGLSEKFVGREVPPVAEIMADVVAGRAPDVPYTVFDMAADVIGLMDGLRIHQAHLMGISMGGMIVQACAAHYPDRILSMASVMSSSGDPSLPPATPEAMTAMTSTPGSEDREVIIQHTLDCNKVYSSPLYPDTDAVLFARAAAAYDRCYDPAGFARQFAGVVAGGDRSELLRGLKVPTLVIHGDADTLIPLAHGRDTAEKIPGAKLEIIEGMGHDLPLALLPRLMALVADHALSV